MCGSGSQGHKKFGSWSETEIYATGGRDPGVQGQEEGGGQGQGQEPPSYILEIRVPNILESGSDLNGRSKISSQMCSYDHNVISHFLLQKCGFRFRLIWGKINLFFTIIFHRSGSHHNRSFFISSICLFINSVFGRISSIATRPNIRPILYATLL